MYDKEIDYLNYSSNKKDFHLNFKAVQQATSKDRILSQIISYIKIGLAQNYWRKDEVTSSLRNQILKDLQNSRMSMANMKSLARSYVWWPDLNSDTKKMF